MSHTKGGNGVNIADEFGAGTLASLPKSSGKGREATPLDPAILANVRKLLTTGDRVIAGKMLFGATTAELVEYNKTATTPVTALLALAKRFAFNGSGNVRHYAASILPDLTSVACTTGEANVGKPKSIGVRLVNEGTEDAPRVRWFLVVTNKREARHGA